MEDVFELYTPLFLASFGPGDYSKGKPQGTIYFIQLLMGNWLAQIPWLWASPFKSYSAFFKKADLSAYAFSVLICLYLNVVLRVKPA